ncbi:MAG: hypothetical protein OXI79_04045 [Gammaproteobacteria bacterium]|nr:hypothetical protein [Gammaproteobacteria bacterium]
MIATFARPPQVHIPGRSPFLFDVRAVGLFRILLAGTILFDQLIRADDWLAFHSASGLVSAADSRAWDSPWLWSVYWLSDGPLLPVVLEGLRVLATLALLFGVRSRLAAFVLFVLLASIAARSPLLLQGGDTVLVVMTFFAAFLPLGQRFSLSRLWFGETPAPYVCSAATLAFAVQILLVWFVAGILKIGDSWLGGAAISMALHLEAFTTETARLWRHWDWLTQPLTLFVFWLECLAPLLALVPVLWCRLIGLAALVILEVGIFLSIEAGLFPLISLVSLVPLVPVKVVDRLAADLSRGRRRTGASLVLFFDRDCRFCAFACRLLLACCGARDAAMREAQSDPIASRLLEDRFAWSVIDCAPHDAPPTADRYRSGWEGVRMVVGRSPRPWLARILPGTVRGAGAYAWIGRNRRSIGRIGGAVFGRRSTSGWHGEAGRFAAASALVVVIAWNTATVSAAHGRLDTRPLVEPLAAATNLKQYWRMFAPSPYYHDYWYVIPALARNGDRADLLSRKPVALRPPRDGPDRYGGYRWRKTTFTSAQRGEFGRVVEYFCRNGHWAAVDLWEFRRPNLGIASTAETPYATAQLGRWRCDDFEGVDAVDGDAVNAFRTDINHSIREVDGVLRGL